MTKNPKSKTDLCLTAVPSFISDSAESKTNPKQKNVAAIEESVREYLPCNNRIIRNRNKKYIAYQKKLS
jgi:hypothetical protein